MAYQVAVDFGTTNTVVALWNAQHNAPEVISLPGLSTASESDLPSLIPSLVYVHDGAKGEVSVGESVRQDGLDRRNDNRLFRNFKRGIVTSSAPEPRRIDGALWGDREAGQCYVQRIVAAMTPVGAEVDQLVLTAPVASFEGYLAWLNGLITGIPEEKIRVVDESTAAALGYAVTEPGAAVLVFDFGGGTLDLSLVQLPESKEKTGGFLRRLIGGSAAQHTAKVIAKTGRVIGGSDIDQWLVAEVLRRTGVSTQALGSQYTALLTACEQAKIALSTEFRREISFAAAGQTHRVTLERGELEQLLSLSGFQSAIRHVVDKVMHIAHRRGIFREDIKYVLLVGGTSLMPCVQTLLRDYFSGMAVRADKPFTAVAEGALQVAAGFGLDDYLLHSYALRYLVPGTVAHQYEEVIPMGSRYPLHEPVEVVLGAAHDGQDAVEFVIGEIDSDSVSMLEVKYEDGQVVFVAQADQSDQKVVELNAGGAAGMVAKLLPVGRPGEDRLKVYFTIDDKRQLRISAVDIMTGQELLKNVVLTTLR